MDGLEWIGQESFAAGAFPLQERVPAAAVEDCVNGLYGDDGSIFKRGGGAYKGAAAAKTLLGVWDQQLAGGQRTVMAASDDSFAFASNDSTVTSLGWTPDNPYTPTRPAVYAGMLVLPFTNGKVLIYGGSRKGTTSYLTGNVDLTEGQTVVTGHGTSWLANVDAGMLLEIGGPLYTVAVAKVNSDTSLTLAAPYLGATATFMPYELAQARTFNPFGTGIGNLLVAASSGRLFVGYGNQVMFSAIGQPTSISGTDLHVLPAGAVVIGLQAMGDRVLAFSTAGVYAIENVAYDLTDALGNVQQRLEPVNSDLILWHDNGIANWHGALIVPAVDNVYLLDAGGASVPIGDPVRKLYRSYVAAGYTLGLATVVQGHYVLPVLNGTTWVDTLVCRLDTRAWGRMSGHSGSCISFATRVAADATRTQKLLGVNGTRIVDATGWFAPVAGNKAEADSTQHNLQVTLRTVQRKTSKDQLMKVRVRYELDDAASDNPTITGEVAVGRPGSAFTTLTGSGAENVGQTPKVWTKIGKRGQEFRVRLTSVGPSSALVLRSVEYGFRPSGRQ